MDFAGSSPQVAKGINSPLRFTTAYATYPLKCALDPNTPQTEGAYRPITVSAPLGCVLNPVYPAPVGARHLTGQCVSNVVLAALSQAVPGLAVAESGSTPGIRVVFSGERKDRNRFTTILFASGGMGAGHGRDGLHCTPFPTNTGCASMEVMESTAPLLFRKREMLEDTCGAGEFRGGAGQEIVMETTSSAPCRLSTIADRIAHPARGILGGGAGSLAALALNEATLDSKARAQIEPGQVLTVRYPGGGGYGDPQRRRREPGLARGGEVALRL
jgi:N-methylhydantoinase B